MTAPHIEYWDNWRIAREKINSIIDEVNASIPSIWDNWNWFIGGVDTWINARWYEPKQWDNLLKIDSQGKAYADLQFASNMTPTSPFNLWITVWNVSSENWRPQNWILLNQKTETSYCRILYWDDWALYFDWWLGVFKRIATVEYVDNALTNLRNDLHRIAYTGKSSDLDNDYWFSAVPIMTEAEYEQIPWTWGDDKEYFLYENINS